MAFNIEKQSRKGLRTATDRKFTDVETTFNTAFLCNVTTGSVNCACAVNVS